MQTALAELVKKDQDIAAQKEEIERVKMLEQSVAKQLKGLLQENERVKNDHRALELSNNRSAAKSPCSTATTCRIWQNCMSADGGVVVGNKCSMQVLCGAVQEQLVFVELFGGGGGEGRLSSLVGCHLLRV